ncbi:Uncharacterised protein [Mycobacteroides abscessus subsp. abscessus]|nr:Uncharacterised protein [Mycobacteroides abscessus subsp. abscessus]
MMKRLSRIDPCPPVTAAEEYRLTKASRELLALARFGIELTTSL